MPLPPQQQGKWSRCRLGSLDISKEGLKEAAKNHSVGENTIIASTFIKRASFKPLSSF